MPLEKLSLSQLKTLCSFKKQKTDKISTSKLKRNELLPLLLSWKDRHNVVEDDETAIVVPSELEPLPIPEVVTDGDNINHDSVMMNTVNSNHHTESNDNIINVTII